MVRSEPPNERVPPAVTVHSARDPLARVEVRDAGDSEAGNGRRGADQGSSERAGADDADADGNVARGEASRT